MLAISSVDRKEIAGYTSSLSEPKSTKFLGEDWRFPPWLTLGWRKRCKDRIVRRSERRIVEINLLKQIREIINRCAHSLARLEYIQNSRKEYIQNSRKEYIQNQVWIYSKKFPWILYEEKVKNLKLFSTYVQNWKLFSTYVSEKFSQKIWTYENVDVKRRRELWK